MLVQVFFAAGGLVFAHRYWRKTKAANGART
jgi:hypothetical protein